MRKRIAWLPVALILLAVLWPSVQRGSAARPPLYLLAVGNRLLATPSETQVSFVSGGLLYVPYTLFNHRADLGVNAQWYPQFNTLLIYSLRDMIDFNLQTGLTIDAKETPLWASVIMHNGIPFVPAEFICNHFQLTGVLLDTGQVRIYRVTAGRPNEWTEQRFMSEVRSTANARANLYLNPPTQTPTPLVCLAITGLGDGTGAILDVLDEYGAPAAFFLEPSAIPGRAELIWRILGGGHSIGLYIHTDSDEDPSLVLLAETGASSLLRTAFYWTRLLWVEGERDVEEQRGALTGAGHIVWASAAEGSLLSGTDLNRAVEGGIPVPLRFYEGQDYHLDRVLQQLTEAGCVITALDERIPPAP